MALTVNSLIDELTYLVKQVKFLLPNVEDDVRRIFDGLSVVQSSLKYAKEGAVEQKLKKDLEEIVRDAKVAIVDYVLRLTVGRRRKTLFKRFTFRKGVARSNFCTKILELGNKLKKLCDDSLRNNAAGETSQENQNNVAGEELSHRGRQLSDWMRSSADYNEREEANLIGLKQDMELLKTRLLDKKKNGLNVISVYGIKGIGKTALAWEVYKSVDVDNYFPCKAWVCVSAVSNDIGEVLNDIGKKVGLQTNYGHEELQKKLCEFLRDKRYLIVIDDVPGTKVWIDLKEAFPDGQNGSRIMLTTCNVELACFANSDGIPHRLWVLSAADSWELFIRGVPWQVRTDASPSTSHAMKLCIPPQLDAIGRKMVAKCKGIPLLIVGLADLVSRRRPNAIEWLSVLHSADMRLIGDDAHRWFNLSVFLEKMVSSHVKQRLPYLCGIFPTKIEIPARRVSLSWAAEGLFLGQNYGELAEEEVAADCLQQLLHFDIIKTVKVSSNGKAKTCSIPPDLPIPGVLISNSASNFSSDDHRCVWFHDDPKSEQDTTHSHPPVNPEHAHSHPPENQQQQHQQQQTGNANSYKTLCSFWCFNFPGGYEPGQQVGRFLERCISEGGLRFLGVLDLEGVYKPCLPEAIGNLINLRFLGLRETYLDDLPSNVGKLLKLQTLDTKHTYIYNYPRSIQKLSKLQHFHLNDGHSSEVVSWLSQLSDLRTLSGVVVDELDLVKDGHLCRLTNLRKLRFTCQLNPQRKESDHWFEGLEHLLSLKVRSIDQKNRLAAIADLEWVTKNQELTNLYLLGSLVQSGLKFPENLTTLTLSGSELTENPMPILEKLPKLQFLRLLSKSFKGQDMVCSPGGFVQLRVLRIWKLEELHKLTVEEGAMPNVEVLELRLCHKLMELSRVPRTLIEFKLTKMPEEFTKKFLHHKGVVIVQS